MVPNQHWPTSVNMLYDQVKINLNIPPFTIDTGMAPSPVQI